MMELQEVIDRRRMTRAFDPDRQVDEEVVARLLRNATHAPSAGFSQGWGFLVLQERDDRERFWSAAWPQSERSGARREAVMTAPLIIVCYSSKDAYLDRYAEPDKGWTDRDESRWPAPFWDIDCGFATLLMMLTAIDEGLGTLFFGLEHHNAIAAAFGVPGSFRALGALAIGSPAPDEPSPSLARGRKPISEIAHFGRW